MMEYTTLGNNVANVKKHRMAKNSNQQNKR